MKKITMILAACAMVLSASAQKTAISGNKFGDNWYVGINGGVTTPTVNHSWTGDITPNAGIRIGKNLTTVFGLAAEGNIYGYTSNSECIYDGKTAVDWLDVNLLGTFNLSNLFCGYKGEPRTFEVSALGGFGWETLFGTEFKVNALQSKVAVDLALNLGKNKAWQVYLEPALVYNLHTWENAQNVTICVGDKYDIKNSMFQLNLGVNYKFGNSNGTHNFAIEALRDQSEIDALNAKINGLRGELADKDATISNKDQQIAELRKALADCENKPAPAPIVQNIVQKTTANLQPTVVFGQGKSVVEKSQEANIALIANYMKNHKDAKIKISGYASPEGSAEINQTLSEKRAEAVKAILVNKYKIAANRLETEGLGATDKLFDEVEFNRVAVFNDMTK